MPVVDNQKCSIISTDFCIVPNFSKYEQIYSEKMSLFASQNNKKTINFFMNT